jgi:anthranilate synthase component 2
MIDNYDSFTYNLAQLFYEFEIEVRVFRNDEISSGQIEALDPDWICISPGPKSPSSAGISKTVIEKFGPTVPILGVCLGMQAINEVYGGRTVKAPVPVHGKRCLIEHNGEGIFRGLLSPFWVARYHSLCVEIGSDCVAPIALAPQNVLMGIRHTVYPTFGVQFHPESFLTENGPEVIANFLSVNGKWEPPICNLHTTLKYPRANLSSSRHWETP